MKYRRLLFAAAFLAFAESIQADPPGLPVGSTAAKAVAPEDKHVLRWKFTKGEVIRYEFKADETIVIQGKEFHNERTYVFRWMIRDVDREGKANIDVAFERVLFKLQAPGLHFDSNEKREAREGGQRLGNQIAILSCSYGRLHSVLGPGRCIWCIVERCGS